MNAEELKYYEALQGKFREAMGELAEGDKVALKFDRNDFDIGFVTQTKTMERDVISADLVYVRWRSDKPWRDQSCDKRDWAEEHFIRLPLPIDPVNPERGLWGMLGSRFGVSMHEWKGEFSVGNGRGLGKGATPTLALLKALAHQWGIEVTG